MRKKLVLSLLIFQTLLFSMGKADQIAETKSQPLQIQTTLGFTLTAGNSDVRILTFDSNIQKPFQRFTHYINFNLAYGTSRYGSGPRIETTNNWSISTRIDWFMSDKRTGYLFLLSALSGNKFRGYWSRRNVQLGAGYSFFDVDTLKLNLALGVDYSKDNLVVKGSADDENFFVLLKPEFEITIKENIRFGSNANWFVDFQDFKNYRINSQTYLNLKLTTQLAINFSFILIYDNKPRLIPEIGDGGKPTGRFIPAKPADKIFNIGISVTV
ncbi:MAG: DUF481 domain-containing protein [Candidatus Kryptonium sp.]